MFLHDESNLNLGEILLSKTKSQMRYLIIVLVVRLLYYATYTAPSGQWSCDQWYKL